MRRYSYDPGHAGLACIAAGPIFVGLLLIGVYVDQAMRMAMPVTNIVRVLPGALLLIPLVVIVGAVLALVPVTVGTLLLAYAADHSDMAAAPACWIALGAAAPTLGCLLMTDDPLAPAALLGGTGALCAALARRGLRRV